MVNIWTVLRLDWHYLLLVWRWQCILLQVNQDFRLHNMLIVSLLHWICMMYFFLWSSYEHLNINANRSFYSDLPNWYCIFLINKSNSNNRKSCHKTTKNYGKNILLPLGWVCCNTSPLETIKFSIWKRKTRPCFLAKSCDPSPPVFDRPWLAKMRLGECSNIYNLTYIKNK